MSDISLHIFLVTNVDIYVWLVHIGGHNILILARDLGHYIQLGTSIDDAIGEAYDKTAKWLGLDLRKSGGPAVEELAREGDKKSIQFKVSYIPFRTLIGFLTCEIKL